MKLDETIDHMFMLREAKRGLEAQIKELKAEIKECEEALIQRYAEVGTITARGTLASATITETVVPHIEDWGAVEQYVLDNDAVYLLHRRVSAGPWKELLDAGDNVPGITPFTARAISLTKLRD